MSHIFGNFPLLFWSIIKFNLKSIRSWWSTVIWLAEFYSLFCRTSSGNFFKKILSILYIYFVCPHLMTKCQYTPLKWPRSATTIDIAQKTNFPLRIFSVNVRICRELRIWPHVSKKFPMENFYAVTLLPWS